MFIARRLEDNLQATIGRYHTKHVTDRTRSYWWPNLLRRFLLANHRAIQNLSKFNQSGYEPLKSENKVPPLLVVQLRDQRIYKMLIGIKWTVEEVKSVYMLTIHIVTLIDYSHTLSSKKRNSRNYAVVGVGCWWLIQGKSRQNNWNMRRIFGNYLEEAVCKESLPTLMEALSLTFRTRKTKIAMFNPWVTWTMKIFHKT